MTSPKLTIGMACHNDFEGVYFTVQALMLYHAEAMVESEIIVVDNNPASDQGHKTQQYIRNSVPNGRYIPYTEVVGTAAPKNRVFIEARGEFVLCMDAHVMLVAGSLARLLEYYSHHPDSTDLFQGPLLSDDLSTRFSHLDPVWHDDFFGAWAIRDDWLNEEDGLAPEIPMQGLGLFSCRRNSWLGFNTRFRGFGGEEGYIHQKYSNAGRATRLLPFLHWTHRFVRSHTIAYPVSRYDKFRNYLIGWQEVALPVDDVLQHFAGKMPAAEYNSAVRDAGIVTNAVGSEIHL